MGIGIILIDKCWVGFNNYGDFFNKFFDNKEIVYDCCFCFGDIIEGLYKKIEEWD